jgi:hypothetical protein
MIDPNDGGWKSRKLWFSVFISLLIFYGAVYGCKHAGFEVMYPELTMGLIGVTSLFFGANSFGKWTIARNAKNLVAAKAAQQIEDEPEDVPPEVAADSKAKPGD